LSDNERNALRSCIANIAGIAFKQRALSGLGYRENKMPNDVTTGTDRKEILALHQAYLAASSKLDEQGFRNIWASDPDIVFFNGNGHTYNSLKQLFKLWSYYRTHYVTEEPWKSHEVHLTVSDGVAFLTCERTARMRWVGEDEPPAFANNKIWRSRSSEIFVKEHGAWKYKHVHISSSAEGPRPGNA
jgi:hypothetical protein